MSQSGKKDAHTKDGAGNLTFWEQGKLKYYHKMLYRSTIQRTTNPDYIAAHPAECKGNLSILEVHPEAKARILKECDNIQHKEDKPTVQRPERLNRT